MCTPQKIREIEVDEMSDLRAGLFVTQTFRELITGGQKHHQNVKRTYVIVQQLHY